MTASALPFRLSVPAGEAESTPAVYALFKLSPMFCIDVEGEESALVAVYPQLRESIEEVIHLVRALQDVTGMHLRVNGRMVADVARFRNALQCYRDTLRRSTPAEQGGEHALCAEGEAAVPEFTCPARDRLLCAASREQRSRMMGLRPEGPRDESAELAEVDWCPNFLGSEGQEGASGGIGG